MSSLRLRMGIVVTLLGILYSLFIGSIAVYTQSILFVVLAGLITSAIVYKGQDLTLRASNAEEVSAQEYPELHNRVGRLAQQAGLPSPDVAVIETSAPNAFVTGWSGDNTTITVTEGLLNTVDEEELDAVLAHELSHIRNNDMAIMMLATTISTIAYSIVRWGWMADDENPHLLAVIAVSLVTWIGSYILMRLLSRLREYAADEGASTLTGQPYALASALRKIDQRVEQTPDEDLRAVSGTNAINFYEVETFATRLVQTHPPTEKRIERLT